MIIEGINDLSDSQSDEEKENKDLTRAVVNKPAGVFSPKMKKTNFIDFTGNEGRISLPVGYSEERRHIFEGTPSPLKKDDPFQMGDSISESGGIMK